MALPPPRGFISQQDPAARDAWIATANAVAGFEPVSLLVDPADEEWVREKTLAGVSLVPADLDDGWLRDNGPTFVLDDEGAPTAVNWVFNAWGGIQDHSRDAQIARTVADLAKVPTLDSSLGQ